MKYDILLFDLDGTLTDPKLGITKSIQYALKKYGIIVDDLDTLDRFIGPPLYKTFSKYYNFDDRKAFEAVGFYREYFSEYGIYENKLYAGIPELLQNLKNSGKKLYVATSKPTYFGAKVIEYFKLGKYFESVNGAEMDGTRAEKDEVIAYTLSKVNVPLEKVVMIGDREYDILGAKKNGIDSIGVTYGYGHREELQNAGANYIIDTVQELEDLLLG